MYIIIHYSEIGTKIKNRDFFEKRLKDNIKKALGKKIKKIYIRYGRIVCELKENIEENKIKKILKKIPGIQNFIFGYKVSLEIDEIKKKIYEILLNKKFETFKIETKRSNKNFEKTSQQINEIVGAYIAKKLKKKVKLENPDVIVYIEICEKEAFVGYKKYRGIGGLPVSSSGKVVCSLSGGIDSPVASFLMMKRGCEVIFVHILNLTQTDSVALKKIEDILKHLTKIQLYSKLYIVPFEKIQKQIIMSVPAKFRMIIYRRFMMKILNEIAKKEKAKGIVTGDSVGQVASQTLENLNCIYDASRFPVFTPLIGMNKEEIIKIAKRIGTYNYSIQPYPDCCSFMIAKHPVTKEKLKEIKNIEKKIKNANNLIKECVKKAKIEIFQI